MGQMGPDLCEAVASREGEHVERHGRSEQAVGLLTPAVRGRWAPARVRGGRHSVTAGDRGIAGLEPMEADGQLDVAATIKRRHGADGVLVAFECTGATGALHEAIRVVRRRGAVVAVGFYQHDAVGLRLGDEFHHNGIRITRGQIGNIHPGQDWASLRAASSRTRRLAARGVRRAPTTDGARSSRWRRASRRCGDRTRCCRWPSPTTCHDRMGVSTWLWTSPLDERAWWRWRRRIASWGFDLVELPIERDGRLGPATYG